VRPHVLARLPAFAAAHAAYLRLRFGRLVPRPSQLRTIVDTLQRTMQHEQLDTDTRNDASPQIAMANSDAADADRVERLVRVHVAAAVDALQRVPQRSADAAACVDVLCSVARGLRQLAL
jgi:hypothetical protein